MFFALDGTLGRYGTKSRRGGFARAALVLSLVKQPAKAPRGAQRLVRPLVNDKQFCWDGPRTIIIGRRTPRQVVEVSQRPARYSYRMPDRKLPREKKMEHLWTDDC